MLLYSLFICFLIYFVIKHIFKVRKYPSGPLSLPIIGNAFQLGYYMFITGSLQEAFKKFRKKNQDKFYVLKKKMDYQFENISFLEACLPQFFLKLSYFKVEAIKNGSHEIPDEANDYVDAFLKEMDKLDKAGIKSSFSLEALVFDVFDLYIAGQETTSTTLAWALIYLLNHPDVTDRVRKELREVTDGSRDLSQNDKPKTPYFNATINEVQRLANIISINLMRKAAEDFQLGGVTIRKGQAVTAQISMVMSDEKYFEEPNKFNPDRYMSGDKLENQTIPFGIGKRACLGESLARAELYLILGNLIQRYEFEAVDGVPSEQPVNPKSSMRRPEKFKIRLVKIE
ncbi:hypothetical protein WR25_06819 [Diploscapter pachys]|uniref:Cytochrome P450 n=1 Tax=Diploscapter pachys TaxID=2018661 RepID=A0A2A2LMY6_9BILA|nr:hypothetical protein WR25_06819 [Diploscapter pachys]